MQPRARLRRCSLASVFGCVTATTFLTLPGHADQPGPIVWYRASQDCPAGTEFLGKLSGAASRARLAEAGDHMDFVVTLQAANGETVGRLERQTSGGTVAIREVRDASCQRVADALALSLTLGLQPSEARTEAPAAVAPAPDLGAPNVESSKTSAATPDSQEIQSKVLPDWRSKKADAPTLPKDAAVDSHHGESDNWWLGAQAGLITGLAPSPMARGAAFVDREGVLRAFAPRFSFRLAVVGALGSSATDAGSVSQWLLGGRLEGCPWRWGGISNFRPCLVFELGAAGARGHQRTGLKDAGPWAAPGATLRGGLALMGRLRLEAEAGALFPLLRHDVYAGSEPLYRAKIASFHAALGLSLGVP